jgi:hypothetical protein
MEKVGNDHQGKDRSEDKLMAHLFTMKPISTILLVTFLHTANSAQLLSAYVGAVDVLSIGYSCLRLVQKARDPVPGFPALNFVFQCVIRFVISLLFQCLLQILYMLSRDPRH